jgi:hypothetical protein
MSSEENDLFPKIIVDTTADGYAEIDEEVEEEPMDEEIPPEDEKPDIPKVEKNVLRKSRKKKEIFQVFEEEPEPPVEEKPEEPAEAPVTRRPRKKITQAQLDHLAEARVKALEAKRWKKAEKLKLKENPVEVPKQTVNMHSVSNIAREMNDHDVDRLIDRYKQRRKSKKAAREADQHTKKLIMSHYSEQSYRWHWGPSLPHLISFCHPDCS